LKIALPRSKELEPMPAKFKWKGKGPKGFYAALDPKLFDTKLRGYLRIASKYNGLLAVKKLRENIAGGKGGFEKNAVLTMAIKGSSVPLVDKGSSLFQAFTFELIDDAHIFVGVKKRDRFYDVAAALHEGADVRVTPAMRALFDLLWKASGDPNVAARLTGRAADLFERFQDWKRLRSSTKAIHIPGRPFFQVLFEDADFQKSVRENWRKAVDSALKAQAKEGK
jgi:hypothetical protein